MRGESGLTLIETLVASIVLVVGLLGTFVLVDIANSTSSKSRTREQATSLARELIEKAHDTGYAQVGGSGWFTSQLQGVSGGTGVVTTPSSNSVATLVSRRGVTYSVTVSWCSVDDSRDGYGAHTTGTTWCSDSGSTGTSDNQPEDLKRVSADLRWSFEGKLQPSLVQAATFAASGTAVGPTTTDLTITQPTGLSPTAPVISSNPTGGIVTFLGTAVGAYDMKFSVDGVEATGGVTNNNNGSWSFNWDISSLKDSTYRIGAIAVDALGTRGQARTLQVKLARGAATQPANVAGGYNDVYVSGSPRQVVELEWDASPEGTVTGYEVLKNGSTQVCAPSLQVSCIDLSPASSGSTTYNVKTLYTDGAGAAQTVSTTYAVTAPGAGGAIATRYWIKSAFPDPPGPVYRYSSTCKAAAIRLDATAVAPTASSPAQTTYDMSGCLPLFPAGVSISAGTATYVGWYRNGSSNRTCTLSYYLYLNGSTIIAGTGQNGTPSTSVITVPSRTSTSTQYTVTFNTVARSFAAGDQLSFYTTGNSTNCSVTGMDHDSVYYPGNVLLPLTAGGGSSLQKPGTPTGLSVVANADGTRTLTWTAPTGSPAVEQYRIYRDGQNYTNRIDTQGATGSSVTWTDTATGGTSHTYRVTAASAALAESSFAGPVTG